MANYAIGDVQGCFEHLQDLLKQFHFDPNNDTLWFCGDLVNRGPKSLETLRFIKSLGTSAITVLGNHDFHLLAIANGNLSRKEDSHFDDILAAPDRDELMHWLRQKPLLHLDKQLGYVITHAGIHPMWDLETAIKCAEDVHQYMIGDGFYDLIKELYGNQPDQWDPQLTGIERMRFIINSFCRMRYCDAQGKLHLSFKQPIEQKPAHLYPWFDVPNRQQLPIRILFGHWASLQCQVDVEHIYGLDSGCVWGNCLTAMRLEDKQRFSVKC